jgi:hypothetical protein
MNRFSRPGSRAHDDAFRDGSQLVADLRVRGLLDDAGADVLLRHMLAAKLTGDFTDLAERWILAPIASSHRRR